VPADEETDHDEGRPEGWISRWRTRGARNRKRQSGQSADVGGPARDAATPGNERRPPSSLRSFAHRIEHTLAQIPRTVARLQPRRGHATKAPEESRTDAPEAGGFGVAAADALRAIVHGAAEKLPDPVKPMGATQEVVQQTRARVEDVAARLPGVRRLTRWSPWSRGTRSPPREAADMGIESARGSPPGKRRKRDRLLARLRGRQRDGPAGPDR